MNSLSWNLIFHLIDYHSVHLFGLFYSYPLILNLSHYTENLFLKVIRSATVYHQIEPFPSQKLIHIIFNPFTNQLSLLTTNINHH